MPRLIFINPEFAAQFCELMDGTLALGRSRQNQIVVLDDSVSARHCELLVYGSEVIVRECGSRNGTFVNGVRVKAQSGVKHGQHLRFGKVDAILELDATLAQDDGDITAHHEHCRALGRLNQPPPAPPQHPVVIAARKQNSDVDPTCFLPGAPSPVPALPVETEIVRRNPGGRRLRWAILFGVLVLLVVLWWFASR